MPALPVAAVLPVVLALPAVSVLLPVGALLVEGIVPDVLDDEDVSVLLEAGGGVTAVGLLMASPFLPQAAKDSAAAAARIRTDERVRFSLFMSINS
jgi:hypothetical protein